MLFKTLVKGFKYNVEHPTKMHESMQQVLTQFKKKKWQAEAKINNKIKQRKNFQHYECFDIL